jgi:hypothetical protein
MSLIRRYVLELLREVTELPKEFFTVVDNAVMSSKFWELPNDDSDDDADGPARTPAAEALEVAVQTAFDELGLDLEAFVTSHFTSDPDYMLHPDHPAYPNRWLVDARWYVSKQKPGQNVVDLQIMLGDEDMGFDVSDVDPKALTRHIASTIRHELVHYVQMKRQRLKKGLESDTAAFDEMLADPKQIAKQEDPKYWEVYEPTGEIDPETKEEIINKEGFKDELWQQDYLKSHIEIDAHAHDAAEDLLAVYSDKEIKNILRGNIDVSDPNMPNGISHYFKVLGIKDPATRKFLSKTYTQVEKMKSR